MLKRKKKQPDNVVRFRRIPQIRIGFVLIFIIFIYVVFHLFSYMTAKNISITEVKQGSIVTNDHFQALAIREEQLYSASEEGYLYYFGRNKSRVGVKSLLYCIDQKGNLAKKLKEETGMASDLGSDEKKAIETQIAAFVNDYDAASFRKAYSFKTNLSETLRQAYSREATARLSAEIQTATKKRTFHNYYAPEPGLVVFSTDGMEMLTRNNYTKDSFDPSTVEYQNLRSNDRVIPGQTIYKLITSDDWNLIMPIDESIAGRLNDVSTLQIRFTEDNATTYTTCEVEAKEGRKYLILSLDDSMERYADSRFVGIDLLLEEESGLKVPNTSLSKRLYYQIPADYLASDEDEGDGFFVQTEKDGEKFLPVSIFQIEDDVVWVDGLYFKGDEILNPPEEGDTYAVSQSTANLSGVYNVNKGYAQFKPVRLLYQNEQYSIVKSIKLGDVALYDHIVLQADLVDENDIID